MSSSTVFRNLIFVGALASSMTVSAVIEVVDLPGSVLPGRIQSQVVPLARPDANTSVHYTEFPISKVALQFKKRAPRLKRVLVRSSQGADLSLEVASLSRPYLGYLINKKNVTQLATVVAEHYRHMGYFAAEVFVPAQGLGHGLLEIIVHEGAVADVQIDNKSPSIQPALQHYADVIKQTYPLTRPHLEHRILLAGQIAGGHVAADIVPDERHLGCVKVVLSADLKRVGADVGYGNQGVRWQGPQQYAGNVYGNSLLQAGDHTHVNALVSVDADELQYYAVEHDMPLGYEGTRLQISANAAKNEPGFTLAPFDVEGKAFSGQVVARHPFILNLSQQFWARLGVRFTDSKLEAEDLRLYKDRVRVALAGVDYLFNDCWQGQSRADLTISQGLNVLGASDSHSTSLSRPGATGDFTKLNGGISYTRPLFNNFSFMIGGQGQYSFNALLASELIGLGGRYWGRAYNWSEIMGDSGVVGTIELRYDTKPGAPEMKNTQYFLAYDAGETWVRNAPAGFGHQSLTSLQAGLRCEFTRYVSADLVVAKPLTRDVLAQELAGHSGDKIRAFFRIALHI